MAEKELTNKQKALQAALDSIRKEFGKGAVIDSTLDFPEIERIPSGSVALDDALGGGYARGRLVEIYGPESSGKTTLALHAIAECQKAGGTCAFIDVECAADMEYAKSLGVDPEQLIFSQPESGEEALNIAEKLARSGAVDLIVIDSVAALLPKAEIEGDIGDNKPGAQARLMSQACRKFPSILKKSNACMIFINQIRMKIGVMFGSPETVSGGNALKFYASQRLDVRRIGVVKNGDDKIAINSKVKLVKNKTHPPFREAIVEIQFGKGINWAKDLLEACVEKGIINKSGAWFQYGEEKVQGIPKMVSRIEEDPDLALELREKLEAL